MLSTSKSKSNRGCKLKRFKLVPKRKQGSHVKQQKKNWLEIPYDVMANILYRVGVYNILENAQKVCTTWHKICKDPAMWRVISMHNYYFIPNAKIKLREMCKHAVDRSEGQLVDLTIVGFADDQLLLYVADRSNHLRRLELACCRYDIYDSWTEALKKFPVLEELNLYSTEFPKKAIETAGRCCPMLTTLKMNQDALMDEYNDDKAIAIGENLLQLRHLELIGTYMSDIELQAILDGCRLLESLDLRMCTIDQEADMLKKCLETVKFLKLPDDSIEGCDPYSVYIYGNHAVACDFSIEPNDLELDDGNHDDEYEDYSDYDDYTVPHDFRVFDSEDDSSNIEELEDRLTFMTLFG